MVARFSRQCTRSHTGISSVSTNERFAWNNEHQREGTRERTSFESDTFVTLCTRVTRQGLETSSLPPFLYPRSSSSIRRSENTLITVWNSRVTTPASRRSIIQLGSVRRLHLVITPITISLDTILFGLAGCNEITTASRRDNPREMDLRTIGITDGFIVSSNSLEREKRELARFSRIIKVSRIIFFQMEVRVGLMEWWLIVLNIYIPS